MGDLQGKCGCPVHSAGHRVEQYMTAVGSDECHHDQQSLPQKRLTQPGLVNVERVLEMGNQFATITVKVESGKSICGC